MEPIIINTALKASITVGNFMPNMTLLCNGNDALFAKVTMPMI